MEFRVVYYIELDKNFLLNHKQRVAVWDWTDVNRGVPQGNVLGPTFLLYMYIC